MKPSSMPLSVIVLLFLFTVPVIGQIKPDEQPIGKNAAPSTVAVLNFENLGQGDPAWDWLGKGLADLTIGDLAGQDLKVVSREQMQEMIHELKLKKETQDPKAVARVLKAARCVHGTYRVDRGTAQLHASILEVATGKQLHTAAVSGPPADLLSLQKKLAAELADVLKGNKPGTIDPAKLPKWTESLQASQLLYQGIDLFDKGEYLTAWGLFRRALRQDPNYADALYWSGRMMYYVQEYHQAQVDLERFCVEHAKHQRVGDAVMEIINAAQLTAVDAEEVLRVLSFAARLAPAAEVANQFGPGYSSTVGLYTAGLAAQILRSQGRYREAFERFGEQIKQFPLEHPLYWITWHEMFALKVDHVKATGELLVMPSKPLPIKIPENQTASGYRSPRGLHPSGGHVNNPIYGTLWTGGDEPRSREFIQLTPKKQSIELDFTSDPLVPRIPKGSAAKIAAAHATTYTRYFSADSEHFLSGFDVELRYRHDPRANAKVYLRGDLNLSIPLGDSGLSRATVALPFGTRAFGIQLGLSANTTEVAILSWKMTAHFRRCAVPTGRLVLRMPEDLSFKVQLNGTQLSPALGTRNTYTTPGGPCTNLQAGMTKIEDLAAGSHKLQFQPFVWGSNRDAEINFDLAAGEVVEVALSAKADPRRRSETFFGPFQTRQISTAYESFRMGTNMGDQVGDRPGDVRFLRDLQGRWIVLWNVRRDLYLAMSSDSGRTWSPTVKLPPPVNSAHDERFPTLMQDATGRYILAFSSDRNLAHAHAVYVCWSEDLINFSAPVMVSSETGRALRVLQHSDGSYLMYINLFSSNMNLSLFGLRYSMQWAVCTSTDLIHWSKPQRLPYAIDLEIVQDKGRYIALSLHRDLRQKIHQVLVQMRTSSDGIHFSAPSHVYGPLLLAHQIVCNREGDRLMAFVGRNDSVGVILRYQGDTTWKQVAALGRGVADSYFWGPLLYGDYGLGENALDYFSLPKSTSPHDSSSIVGGRDDSVRFSIGQPLLLTRNEYEWKQLPKDDPLAKLPPSDVEAKIIKRYPAPAPPARRPGNK